MFFTISLFVFKCQAVCDLFVRAGYETGIQVVPPIFLTLSYLVGDEYHDKV